MSRLPPLPPSRRDILQAFLAGMGAGAALGTAANQGREANTSPPLPGECAPQSSDQFTTQSSPTVTHRSLVNGLKHTPTTTTSTPAAPQSPVMQRLMCAGTNFKVNLQHAQYPGAKVIEMTAQNPAKFHELIGTETGRMAHDYIELRLSGFALDKNNQIEKKENGLLVITAKIGSKLLPFSQQMSKATLSIFDPSSGRRIAIDKAQLPLVGALTGKSTSLHEQEDRNSFFSKNLDVSFQKGKDGAVTMNITSPDVVIEAEFLSSQGYSDAFVVPQGEKIDQLRRLRTIEVLQLKPNGLSITQNSKKIDLADASLKAVRDRSLGYFSTDTKHSWDWFSYMGKTEDGKPIYIIVEGTRSPLNGAEPEQNGNLIIFYQGQVYRFAGKVTYPPHDPTNPEIFQNAKWPVSFVNDDEVEVSIQTTIDLKKAVEDNSLKVPLIADLEYHRAMVNNPTGTVKFIVDGQMLEFTLDRGTASLERAGYK